MCVPNHDSVWHFRSFVDVQRQKFWFTGPTYEPNSTEGLFVGYLYPILLWTAKETVEVPSDLSDSSLFDLCPYA